MIMFFRFLLGVYLTVQVIHGTDEEVRFSYMQQALECNKDHPIAIEDFQMLHESKVPDSGNAKCLLACIFKNKNLMDSKGMFNVESAAAEAEKDYAGDETKLANSKKLMEICSKVNSETVKDGEAGCERAFILFQCFNEFAPQFGFEIHGNPKKNQ